MRTFDELTHEQAEAYLQEYVATLPALVERLRVRSARTAGPALDASVDSVAPLEVWFHEQLFSDDDDGLTDCPSWWLPGTENGTGFHGELLPSLRQVRLVDEVAAYVAEVLRKAAPQARWVVYCVDPKIRDIKQHKPVLVGPFGMVDPVQVIYNEALGPITYGETPKENDLYEWVLSKLIPTSERSDG